MLDPGNYFAQKIEVKVAEYLILAYLLFSPIFILSYFWMQLARFITTAGVLTGFGVHASDMFDVAAEIVVSCVPAAA